MDFKNAVWSLIIILATIFIQLAPCIAWPMAVENLMQEILDITQQAAYYRQPNKGAN